MNSIQKDVAITIDIAKNPRKVFFSKDGWCHDENYKAEESDTQTSPGLREGKPNEIAQSNPHVTQMIR